ncbi:DNA/RNA non-specific endonuclease family protein [Streptococcus pyogenes]|nr:DNA/RNA non-specific endonuclease family protein [Streptococcus pyogenes]VGV59382.1 DNA/RNA non-specific endonuclease family protein [Streptococcus pyogenes]VGV60637.1 DNA/RNA non-specific endonuclease family protein [Streptococcus pyogenes]VHC12134.1 DNA/RNA non-specific endonuclease family protein [Streptococcus pyogenes]
MLAKKKRKRVQEQKVPKRANALLTKSTRQYRNRYQTDNAYRNFKPAGWHRLHHLKGSYDHKEVMITRLIEGIC